MNTNDLRAVSRIAFVAALGLIPIPVTGQAVPFLSLDRLTVQSDFNKKLIPAPAKLLFTFVPGRQDSYSADFAVRYNTVPSDQMAQLDFGPFVEYHRNTQTDKEQFLVKAGLSLDWNIGDLVETAAVPILIANLNYVEDREKDSQGLQASATVTSLSRGRGLRPQYFWIPNITSRVGFFDFLYEPDLGLELQHTDKSGTEPAKGRVLRAVVSVKAILHPFAEQLGRRVALTAGYTYRNVFVDSDDLEDAQHQIFKASADWTLFGQAGAKNSAGVSLSYLSGTDPTSGIDNQEYTQLAFSVRI